MQATQVPPLDTPPPVGAGGGPPAPPESWRGEDGGGRRWPWWKVLLLCLVTFSAALAQLYVLWRGGLRFPASVISGLLVLTLYWIRQRPLQHPNVVGTVPGAVVWAGLAGTVAFLVTHVSSPPVGWLMLLAGAFGLGGAAGLFAWMCGNLLFLSSLATWWLVKDLRHSLG